MSPYSQIVHHYRKRNLLFIEKEYKDPKVCFFMRVGKTILKKKTRGNLKEKKSRKKLKQ